MWLILTFILLLIASYWVYKYGMKPLDHWKKRNIPFKKPLPFVGNMLSIILKQKSFSDWFQDFYSENKDKRYIGLYAFSSPVLMLNDLELIKNVAIKNFDHFTDHKSTINLDNEPLFARNLLNLSGEKWKDMRSVLSPAFTSSKMRGMFYLMKECSKEFVKHFLEKNEKSMDLEMKDVFTRFTNDVIASTAFGIELNSYKDKDNDFFKMGQSITNVSGVQGVKLMLISFAPAIAKLLKLQIFGKFSDFFANLVVDSIKTRKREHIVRPDMIHLLMEAQNGRLKHEEDTVDLQETGFATVKESEIGTSKNQQKEPLNDLDIAAQALLFFFAGFETSATVLSFLVLELAINMDVQEKLQQEIDETLQYNQEISYEVLLKMKYLDMVICETLRKWSPAPAIERMCVKEIEFPAENDENQPLKLEIGDSVQLPVRGIHYNPEYYSEPDKFYPERFSEENKDNIKPYTYLPFGLGPRNCIGSRFALLEMKTIIFYLFSKFSVIPNKKTCIPIKLACEFRMAPKELFCVTLEKR